MKGLLLALAVSFACLGITGSYANSFSIVDGRIIDPQGQDFVAKGVNIFPDQSVYYEQIVNCWQFNFVRANHFPDSYWYNPTWTFDQMIERFTANNIVVLLDLAHDSWVSGSGIGQYWDGRWSELAQSYAYYADRYQDNPYVWFETTNEPGTTVLRPNDWVALNQQLITAVRDTGNSNPIVVDAWCWGQDSCAWDGNLVQQQQSSILSLGDQLLHFNGQDQQNIVFTHHVFDQFNNNGVNKLEDYYQNVINAGKALIVTEYGSVNHNSTLSATQTMLQAVENYGIGRVVWTWSAGDDNDLVEKQVTGGGEEIDHCRNPGNLTELGELVWADNHAKSSGKSKKYAR